MEIRAGRKSILTLYSAQIFTAFTLSAQETGRTGGNPVPADTSASDESVTILDPFSVSSETESYKAVDTSGCAKVRTNLADTPSSLSVVTTKELQDLAITTAQDLLVYTKTQKSAGLAATSRASQAAAQVYQSLVPRKALVWLIRQEQTVCVARPPLIIRPRRQRP
jgi:outer membrane receptor for ferric coprogen and ferric-rhodotorulic acid